MAITFEKFKTFAQKFGVEFICDQEEQTYGFEGVAGLNLRNAIEYLQLLLQQIRSSEAIYVPQALLFAGPPGTGKSFLIKAFAKEMGWCLLKLVSKWRTCWNSEQILEMALWIIETTQPCIVWIDQIDMEWSGQWNTRLSNDISISGRIIGRLLEAIRSVKHGRKILWIGESTCPDILPLNCFPVLIPFLHPSTREIQMLLPVLARQVGRELAEDVNTFEIAQILSHSLITVRVLQEVISVARFFADTETEQPGTPIRQRHLPRAACEFKPNYNFLVHEYIALTALRMYSFPFLLP